MLCGSDTQGITRTRLNEHITPVLRDTLLWLSVTQHIDYKIALMTYSCVHGTSPAYFNGICRPVASVECRAMLRSANYGELVEPRMRGKRYGPRATSVLPHHLSERIYNDTSETMTVVVNNSLSDLTTFLFARAYSSEA